MGNPVAQPTAMGDPVAKDKGSPRTISAAVAAIVAFEWVAFPVRD
jgi:hypothetical protein